MIFVGKPKYRLISRFEKESHTELVAEKLGFSSKDIDKYLRFLEFLKGYDSKLIPKYQELYKSAYCEKEL
jgi:hypothetical protein